MKNGKWANAQLGKHVDLLCGFAFKSKNFTDDPNDIPLVKGANVHQGYIDWADSKYWPRNDAADYTRYFLEADDVVLAMDRPWIEAGLKFSWIRKHHPQALLVQRVARMRGINGLQSSYLRFIIGSHFFTDYIKPIVTGINVPHISADQIKGFHFPLPPEHAQRKIAGVLSAYDDLIENNIRRIAVLEEMAQAIYREWFVNFRFPGYDKVKLINSPLGKIPEGWKRPFPDYVDFLEGPGLRRWQYREEGIPFLNIRTIGNNDIDLSKCQFVDPAEVEQKYSHFLLRPLDHIVSSSGTIGRIATVQQHHLPLMLNTSIIRMAPKNEAVGRWQLKHFLQSPYFQDQIVAHASGVAQMNYGPSHLKLMWIIAPDEATGIAYEQHVEAMESLLCSLVKKNTNLRTTRDLLLPKLISGKLDVEDLDIDTGEPLVEAEA